MKDVLYHSQKIEMRRSSIHGWGIFAKEFIRKDEILEEVPFLIIPMSPNESTSIFLDYRFNYPSGSRPWKNQVIPFGFACLYNHSDNKNVRWFSDEENEIFIFQAIQDIEPDTEITTYYGSESYWNDGRTHIKIK